MSTMFNYVMEKFKSFYALIFGVIAFAYYFMGKKTAKLEEDNKALNTNLEELNIEAKKIVTIQNKQNIIAAKPAVSRNDIDKWLHDLSRPDSEKP